MQIIKREYGRYNSTVKTVLDMVEQANGGYHIAASDARALRYAIADLQAIVDKYPIEAALKGGEGYSPAVLVKDGADYMAYIYTPQVGAFTKHGSLERAGDAIDSRDYLNNSWTAYTNGPATLEWLQGEGFTLEY